MLAIWYSTCFKSIYAHDMAAELSSQQHSACNFKHGNITRNSPLNCRKPNRAAARFAVLALVSRLAPIEQASSVTPHLRYACGLAVWTNEELEGPPSEIPYCLLHFSGGSPHCTLPIKRFSLMLWVLLHVTRNPTSQPSSKLTEG